MSASRMPSMRWLGLAFEGGLGLLAFLLGWFLDVPPLATLSWDWGAFGSGLLACVPMLGLFAFCLWCPLPPFRRLKAFTCEFILPLFEDCTTLDLLLIAVAAGFGEEMLFRGLVQAGLSAHHGVAAGLVVGSILFGLAHLLTFDYFVLGTLMGVYLGSVWLCTGNLLSVVVAHAVYDFLALVLLVRRAPECRSAFPG